jgi:hypothetical protein
MSANSRMTVPIHIPACMILVGRKRLGPATSEQTASSVNTDPVMIRRLLGCCKSAGWSEATAEKLPDGHS